VRVGPGKTFGELANVIEVAAMPPPTSRHGHRRRRPSPEKTGPAIDKTKPAELGKRTHQGVQTLVSCAGQQDEAPSYWVQPQEPLTADFDRYGYPVRRPRSQSTRVVVEPCFRRAGSEFEKHIGRA